MFTFREGKCRTFTAESLQAQLAVAIALPRQISMKLKRRGTDGLGSQFFPLFGRTASYL